MRTAYVLLFYCFFLPVLRAQNVDFKNSIYYTASANNLTSSGNNLSSFNFTTAPSSHPLFNTGIFFPVSDFQNNNLWVKVTHIAHDPNGNSVGANVPKTCGDPFRAGFGGWGGFLFEFEIYKDLNFAGERDNVLNGLHHANITLESIETLSFGEWLSFEILNPESSAWILNSINFTGNNPTSKPGFSAAKIPWPGSQPPAGFSTTFPVASKNVYVVDYGSGNYYAEFQMSAADVSRFRYGYEFTSLCAGYQGMRLLFGVQNTTPVRLISFEAANYGNQKLLNWKTADELNFNRFVVQRSINGIDFTNIGIVQKKDGSSNNTYSYSDIVEGGGVVLYRLKMEDLDGSFKYSPVIKVGNTGKQSISIWPNPVHDYLQVNNPGNSTVLKVFDIKGRLMLTENVQPGNKIITVSTLIPGMYIAQFTDRDGKSTHTKFIKE
ncbi:MAG TPA: T9SS type A sorting domain-containing protein [Ferruginibacter sp.]|nr:T9SS type A sorting domain-containing protein [Ferruginibacter sp.]HMP21954.1 T9SS type A sorting domain-containing protein [Ferruginibacter sp.]